MIQNFADYVYDQGSDSQGDTMETSMEQELVNVMGASAIEEPHPDEVDAMDVDAPSPSALEDSRKHGQGIFWHF